MSGMLSGMSNWASNKAAEYLTIGEENANIRSKEMIMKEENLPSPESWKATPIFIRNHKKCKQMNANAATTTTTTTTNNNKLQQLPINSLEPIEFETDLFKGKIIVRLAGLPDSPEEYFANRARKMQVAIQGSFKKRLPFNQVKGGQEFEKKLHWLPNKRIVDTVFKLLSSKLPPTFEVELYSETPYFYSPLVNTCQGFAIEEKGKEQDIMGNPETRWQINENTDMLGSEVPKSGEARRKFFAHEDNLKRFFFEPDLIYTFDYYQHYMNFVTMNFEVSSYLKFATAKMLGDQPLLLTMAKENTSGKYIWNFELWHASLVEGISTNDTCNNDNDNINDHDHRDFNMQAEEENKQCMEEELKMQPKEDKEEEEEEEEESILSTDYYVNKMNKMKNLF